MTTLNDIYPTDDVDDVLDTWVRELMGSTFRSEFKNVETLSATRVLLDADTPIQRFNCNGADRIAKMPTADAINNHPYLVVNSTSSGSWTLTVQDSAGIITLATLSPSGFVLLMPDGAGGYFVINRNVAGVAGKNILPNGGFSVAQRGAGPFTSATTFVNNDDTYLLDGCIFLANGSDTCDVSQVADNDFVSGYKIRLDVETANRRFGILLPVEKKDIQDIRKSGKASFQFKVKRTGTSMSNVRAYLLAWNSTADVITSDVISSWGSAGADPTFATNWTAENTASNLAVGTTVTKYEIGNISVDTSGVTNLAVLLIVDDTDATVGDYLEFGDIKLEEGEFCTPFVNPLYDETLLRCRRHFEAVTHASGQNSMAGLADSTSVMICFFNYKVTKRIAAHTYSYSALSDFTIRYAGGATTVVTATTIVGNNTEGATLTFTGTGTPLTAGQALQLRAANANAVLYFSSEL